MLKPREERDEKTGEVTTRPGWCRTFINRQIARIKLMFKWATENELLLPSVYHGLSTVGGLRKGRSDARESDQVKPAPDHAIETILPRVSRHVRRRFDCSYSPARGPARPSSCGPATSTRPGPCGYRPHRHKGEHHEHEREIRVGPKAQAEIARQRFTTPS